MTYIARIVSMLVACACVTGTALAQKYPTKAIRIIVPQLPGDSCDTLARVLGQKMGEHLGQQLVVDNRPGASGTIGLAIAAQAPADGYTLGVATSGMSIHQALAPKKRPFDVIRDFTPIILLATTTTVLAGKAALPPDPVLAAGQEAAYHSLLAQACRTGGLYRKQVEQFFGRGDTG